MTLESCKLNKEHTVGAGPQKMEVYLLLIPQYAAQSKRMVFILCGSRIADKTVMLISKNLLSSG